MTWAFWSLTGAWLVLLGALLPTLAPSAFGIPT